MLNYENVFGDYFSDCDFKKMYRFVDIGFPLIDTPFNLIISYDGTDKNLVERLGQFAYNEKNTEKWSKEMMDELPKRYTLKRLLKETEETRLMFCDAVKVLEQALQRDTDRGSGKDVPIEEFDLRYCSKIDYNYDDGTLLGTLTVGTDHIHFAIEKNNNVYISTLEQTPPSMQGCRDIIRYVVGDQFGVSEEEIDRQLEVEQIKAKVFDDEPVNDLKGKVDKPLDEIRDTVDSPKNNYNDRDVDER